MVRAVDQLEGAMDDASDGSEINRRSDGWCERWIRELQKERRMMQAMDQRAIGRAMDGARGGPASNRRSDRLCERWIMELQTERRMVQAMEHSVIEGAMVAASD